MSQFVRRVLTSIVLVMLLMPTVRPVQAGTYQVTNNNDSGNGSLRAAIAAANTNPGADTIEFSIPAGQTWTINLVQVLPALTDGSTTINGPLDNGKPRVALNGSFGSTLTYGMYITSVNNTVRGLAIYGFGGFTGGGILVSGAAATGNTIENNFVGTNLDGTAKGAIGTNNDSGGVVITNGASSNIVRNNLISGNGMLDRSHGVVIGTVDNRNANPARNNIISGNKIGVAFNGNDILANNSSGIFITSSALDNTIGPDNVIAGNGVSNSNDYGVFISGYYGTGLITGNKVQGNRIGVTANGSLLANKAGGINIDRSQNTLIGGGNVADSSNADRGNIIAGNSNYNILVQQQDGTLGRVNFNTTIRNNFIGNTDRTNASGSAIDGIQIRARVSGLAIDSNVISGNQSNGIQILNNSVTAGENPTNIAVTNNRIGTNADGTARITGTNQLIGLFIRTGVTNITVSGNTISGNRGPGVRLNAVSAITLTNNEIGALKQNNAAIGNGSAGVEIIGSSSQITVGPGNTLAGHTSDTSDGMYIGGSSTNNIVKGNTVTGNNIGIRVDDGASGNSIGYAGTSVGATGASDGNNVIGNKNGIVINGAQTLRNRISRTQTSNNIDVDGQHYGIQLSSGGNGGIQAPVLSGVNRTGNTLTGTINTNNANCTGSGCVIEIFQNTVNEPNEGKFFLSSFAKVGNGSASFSVPDITSCSRYLTFTTTDNSGNTSQFSTVQDVPACNNTEPTGDAIPDLFEQTPPSITVGAAVATTPVDVAFTAKLKNVGTGAGTFDLALAAPSGWSNATVTPTSAALAANVEQSVSFGVRVPAGTQAGTYTLRLTATKQGGGASDSVEVAVVVPLVSALSFEAANPATKVGGPGGEVCFTHRLTNQGNGPDQFNINVAAPTGWSSRVVPGSPVALDRGAAQDVQVCVTVPSGASGGNYTINVVAQSVNTPTVVSPTRTDTVTVQDAGVPQISTAAAQSVDPGSSATFNHVLTNIGNATAAFVITVSGPNGWTVTPTTITTPALARNGTYSFSVVAQVPAGALAGPYTLTVTATAQDSVASTTSVADTVNVNRIANLKLTPATQSSTEPPNSVVTYTLTLQNDGNFTDIVQLNVAEVSQAARGWTASVTPPSVSVAPGANTVVNLVVRIPPGQPTSVQNVTTVTATSSVPETSAEAKATTNIAPVAGVLLTPQNPVRQGIPGETATFDFTLLNSGSLNQNYTATVVSTNPVTATIIFTGTTNKALAPGESVPLKLSVKVPANQPERTEISVRIRATSSPGNATAETLATVRIGPPYGVLIDPDRTGASLPGQTVQYTHYVTNTGRLEDSITLTPQSNLGWTATVVPSSVRLAAGASVPVVLTIQIPGTADAGAVDTTYITARSVGDPTVFERATATTQVLQAAGVNISPSRFAPLRRGEIRFLHTLNNLSNGRDTFTITTTQDLNWPIAINYTAPRDGLSRGGSQLVQVVVTVPADAPPDARNRIIVRAVSRYNPTVSSEAVDVIAPSVLQSIIDQSRLYMPLVRKP